MTMQATMTSIIHRGSVVEATVGGLTVYKAVTVLCGGSS